MSTINSTQPVPLPPLPAGPIDRINEDLDKALPGYRDAAGNLVERVRPGQRHATPAPEPASEAATDGTPERGGIAEAAVVTSMLGGVGVNAIDVARLLKKYPEALRAGKFDPSLGRFGRIDAAIGQTIAMAPNRHVIDPLAPRVASAASLGKSFTKFDEVVMKSATLLSSSLAAIQFGSSIPNLIDAAGNEGPWHQNMYDNESGRSGVLQFAGGGLGLAMLGTALAQTDPKRVAARDARRAAGIVDPTAGARLAQLGKEFAPGALASRAVRTSARVAAVDVSQAVRPAQVKAALGRGAARVIASGKAPVMANPLLKYVGLASGFTVMANELGYFSAFDRNNKKSVGTTLHDAASNTIVLNDRNLRTAAFTGATGLVAWKTAQAVLKDGGMRNIGKGHVAGMAITAGLLGANLLGKLDGLNKD